LVFLQHFRGNLDNWDPALVDAIAAEREVILVDNVGVGLSSGITPNTVAQMARDVIAFIDALNVTQIDLLGFSLGGFVTQEVALMRPRLEAGSCRNRTAGRSTDARLAARYS
jgi:pimeloyl-ACP methyl ester carboxylesterase